jgi:chemotaxis protein MotB
MRLYRASSLATNDLRLEPNKTEENNVKMKDCNLCAKARHHEDTVEGVPISSITDELKDLEAGLIRFSEQTAKPKKPATLYPNDSFSGVYMINEEEFDDRRQDMTDASSWAIPWSDLMMTMFILFAVMLVYTLSERNLKDALAKENNIMEKPLFAEKIKGPVSGKLDPEQLFELSRQTVKEANLEDIDVVLSSDRSVRVSVRGPMLFDLGSAELRNTTKDFLKKIAVVLSKTENEVHIVGHTDNYPVHSEVFPTNWELSSARAARVARFLIEQGSLNPERFTVTGNAMYRPSVLNTTLENKQKNRRVEIIITKDTYNGHSGG